MADQAITALPKKTYSGSSKIAATDYLLGIDSAEGYQMLIQDLGEYIINRVTASLAGSNQTLAAAISALNSKTTPLVSGVGLWNGNIDTYKTTGVGWIQMPSSTGTSPGFEYFALLVFETGNSGIVAQIAIDLNGQSKTRIFANGNWKTWA